MDIIIMFIMFMIHMFITTVIIISSIIIIIISSSSSRQQTADMVWWAARRAKLTCFIGQADCSHYNCNHNLFSESGKRQLIVVQTLKPFAVAVAVVTVCWYQ